MAQKKKDRKTGLIEKRKLSASQITFLAKEASLPTEKLADLRIIDVADSLGAYLDPYWLFNRKVCGRVVQRDPLTGELRGVPGATVEVQDTDCSGWFRKVGGFQWFYPFGCTRDTIATAVTDECGYFCVWIPRWLFEWIRTWRRERICLPLDRPRLIDVIDPPFDPDPPIIRDPGWIDPLPEKVFRIDPRVDHLTADRIGALVSELGPGSSRIGLDRLLAAPLQMPRPSPPSDADLVGYTPDPDGPVDFTDAFGPYWVCRDIYVPEWQVVLDVPDITFHVTQEINGADVEVYSEGYFEVRWDDSGSGDVILEANELAVSVDDCDVDNGIICEDTIAIISASEMPLDQSATPLFHDDASGFGVRVNRPSASPTEWEPPMSLVANAESPIADTLVLRGCVHINNAQYYRLMYDRGAGPEPITGTSWPAWHATLGIITIAPDADGWIEIQNLIGGYQHLLMKWPTVKYPNASYDVVLEVADSTRTVLQQSAGHTFVLDNSQPTFTEFAVRYRVGDDAFSAFVLDDCPKIFREPAVDGVGGEAVEIEVTWRAGADHLRDAFVKMGGCGGGNPTVDAFSNTSWYWQTSGAVDTGSHTAVFTISATADAGCYSLTRRAVSRAYNPATASFIPSSFYWENDRRRWTRSSWSISVVDE
jgi:hypothetical protein